MQYMAFSYSCFFQGGAGQKIPHTGSKQGVYKCFFSFPRLMVLLYFGFEPLLCVLWGNPSGMGVLDGMLFHCKDQKWRKAIVLA